MTVTALVSSKEIRNTIANRYTATGHYFRVALVNTNTTYVRGVTSDIDFMANEIEDGLAGYTSPYFQYTNSDIGIYADEGIPLARKAATFTHDGSATSYDFTHVVLLRKNNITGSASGTALTVDSFDREPELTDELNGWVLTGTGIDAGTGITAYTGTGGASGPWFYTLNQSVTATGTQSMVLSQIIAVAELASTATLSDSNEAVFYFDLKHFTYYQV